jgi:hypothetical protein
VEQLPVLAARPPREPKLLGRDHRGAKCDAQEPLFAQPLVGLNGRRLTVCVGIGFMRSVKVPRKGMHAVRSISIEPIE